MKTEDVSPIKAENVSQVKLEIEDISRATIALSGTGEGNRETQMVVPIPLTPTSQPSPPNMELLQQPLNSTEVLHLANHRSKSSPAGLIPEVDSKVENSISASSSDDSDLSISTNSDSEDSTSSSGSSSDDDAPETAPSTRTAPKKVPPPKKPKQKAICRNFLKSGRCARGDNCMFRHELPERGSQAAKKKNEGARVEARTERKGLYQRVR